MGFIQYTKILAGLLNKYSFASLFLIASMSAQAATISVNCDSFWRPSINFGISRANDGDTVAVSGSCEENVVIDKDIILDGGGLAALSPEDPAAPTIIVKTSDASITNFAIEGTSEFAHISVQDHSSAVIDNNIIANASYGIFVNGGSLAVVVNSQINNNSSYGIFIGENSTGRIGFRSFDNNIVAEPNTIESNQSGVAFARAMGYVSGNYILDNTQAGVQVTRSATVRVTGNEIDGNQYGIINLSEANTDLAFEGVSELVYGSANFGVNTTASIVCNAGTISDTVGADFVPVIATGDCVNKTIP